MTDEEREARIFLAAEEVRHAIEELFDLCIRDDGRAAAMMVNIFVDSVLYGVHGVPDPDRVLLGLRDVYRDRLRHMSVEGMTKN
jgi:hypothetical protein